MMRFQLPSVISFFLVSGYLFGQNLNLQVYESMSFYRGGTCELILDGYTCTGTILNNPGEYPETYILTAAHCFDYPSQINTLVVEFGNYSITIDGKIDSYSWKSDPEVELLAFSQEIDFALLRLKQDIPDEITPVYMGWNSKSYDVLNVSSFHYPEIESGEIAHSRMKTISATYYGLDNPIENGHWKVSPWALGMTSTGSSGAALLDADFRVVGGLSGSGTKGGKEYDYFFKMSTAWDYFDSENSSLLPYLGVNGDRSMDFLTLKTLKGVQKVSSYNYTDSISAQYTFGLGDSITIDFSTIRSGKLVGVYIPILDVDGFPELNVGLFDDTHELFGEQVSLSGLDDHSEIYFELLQPQQVNSGIKVVLSAELLNQEELVLPVSELTNPKYFCSLLVQDAEIEELNSVRSGVLSFAPNPSYGIVVFNQLLSALKLIDSKGNQVAIPLTYNFADQTILDTSSLAPGMYILQAFTEDNVLFIERLIIY